MEAEYVLLELNGLFTYTYSLTAGAALCRAQPQNWTSIMRNASEERPFAWDREVVVTLQLVPQQASRQVVTTDCTWLGGISAHLACYHRTPETGGLQTTDTYFSLSWRLEVQDQGTG